MSKHSFHAKQINSGKSLMKFFLTICALFFCSVQMSSQHVQFTGNSSLTWQDCVNRYEELDEKSDYARLTTFGFSDNGKPLHLFVINKDGVFYPELFDRGKTIILVNNDIHAGEPDGVDACIMLCDELLGSNASLKGLLDSIIFCVVPMYNVDGALRRASNQRANQNGPEEYGFRANARNLDLNRDFIKCDSRNARSFAELFSRVRPHLFVDTHVSNGADYKYTMTLISTQPDKLGGICGDYLREKLEPALYAEMKNKGDDMCPYVNTMGRTPESGIIQFLETPRFSTGYAALFNTIGFTSETHMLKPFPNRVESTYRFLLSVIEYADNHCHDFVALRERADKELMDQRKFALTYKLDTTHVEEFLFSGYEAKTMEAAVGNGSRLYYDHKSGWERPIPYYTRYIPDLLSEVPDYYIIPQAWHEVIERLKLNGVRMEQLPKDTTIKLNAWVIREYKSPETPYEGHFLHSDVKADLEEANVRLYAGDCIIRSSQPAIRFLAQVLDPRSEDSYFAWNFFDSVLQQKEWFSDYVFEERAAELLRSDEALRKEFDTAMKSDASLKDNHWNQLYWIYRHSPYYEQTVNRYPVYYYNGGRLPLSDQ